ncbi:MAG: DEAD/DEAH box helicase [Thermodesulfobacteriota bacterium]
MTDEDKTPPAGNDPASLTVTEPADALPEISLDDLPRSLQDACARAGWDKLMPVQARALPYLLAGREIMVQSRTGSGKTGSFVLPLLEHLDPYERATQALVLVPTRELAQQVAREATTLFGDTGLKAVAVVGGASFREQLDAFAAGAHLVVGTPGRVLDHLIRRTLSLESLRVLVLDEADRMLSIGFYPDMKAVQRHLPKHPILTLMTSATYPPYVMRLAGEFLREPQILSLSRGKVHVAEITHAYCVVSGMDKDRALVRLIEMENPSSAFIFCNTKARTHYVTAVLQRFGYDADELSGDLTQARREQVLEGTRSKTLRFLVATDVAARGIDVSDLSHVFLYEPPEDSESYIHRAGRTGRAGAGGTVITLVDLMEELKIQRIGRFYQIDLEKRPAPTDQDVARVAGQRAQVILEAARRGRDKLQAERMQRFVPLAGELAGSDEGRELLAMLLDDAYHASQHQASAPAEGAAPQQPGPEAGPRPSATRRRRRKPRGGGGEGSGE